LGPAACPGPARSRVCPLLALPVPHSALVVRLGGGGGPDPAGRIPAVFPLFRKAYYCLDFT
jgi:hypothetical protein